MKMNNTASGILIGAALLVTSITAFSTLARSNAVMAPAPTVVGIVDIQKMINGSTEFKARGEQRKARDVARQAEIDKLKTELEGLIEAGKLKAEGSPESIKAHAEAIVKRATLEAQFKAYQQLSDIEAGDLLSDIHGKIVASIDALAKREGYQLVLTDDRNMAIPKNRPSEDVISAMSSRRVLYADPSIDITDRVLTAMNNEYEAGKSK